MNGYVATTDGDWFRFLSDQEQVDEVNFWQPNPWGGSFGVLRRGEPLFFKLKAPDNAIAGLGFFEQYSELPLSLAWDAFGIKNGAASLQAVRERLVRLRRRDVPWYEDFVIGCILLSEPVFWPRDLWIPEPADWRPQIVRGKTYDLTRGVGRELWDEVLLRLEAVRSAASPDPLLPGGYGEPTPTPHRIGQGIFRVAVTEAYGRRCAITREKALPALDAAHIRPFADNPVHYVRNGMLLRSDVHKLFDAGYITVTPDYHVLASRRMKDDFDDGDNYLKLDDSPLWLPATAELRPDPDALRWHNDNRFRG